MQYVVFIYGNKELWDSFPAEAWPEQCAAQEAFNAEFRATGELVASHGLGDESTARAVRVRDGVTSVAEGPYVDAAEFVSSMAILDVDSHERALEIASRIPFASFRGVEVWPVLHPAAADL